MLHQIANDTVTWNAAALEIHTLPDRELDTRREHFFGLVEHLIFREGPSEVRKAAILRRYARQLTRNGERALADLALQLADTYETVINQFH